MVCKIRQICFFSVAPPVLPVPVGIHFRIYTPGASTGAVVTWAIRGQAAAGRLPRRLALLMLTFCTWIVATSNRGVKMARPADLLSANPLLLWAKYLQSKINFSIIMTSKSYTSRKYNFACQIGGSLIYLRWGFLFLGRFLILIIIWIRLISIV